MLGNKMRRETAMFGSVECRHCTERDKRNTCGRHRGWLAENSATGRHGLAAILAVTAVRGTMHRAATVHGLLGGRDSGVIQCIVRQTDGEQCNQEASSEAHGNENREGRDVSQTQGRRTTATVLAHAGARESSFGARFGLDCGAADPGEDEQRYAANPSG